MAEGYVHEKVNVNILKISTGISFMLIFTNYLLLLKLSILFCISPCIGALLGLFTTPDSDLVSIEYTRPARIIKYIVPSNNLYHFICKLHTMIWAIYIVAVPHRSIISHSLIIGALGRLLYILGIIFVIQWFIYGISFSAFIAILINIWWAYTDSIILIFLFWSIQDQSHLYLDSIFLYPRREHKTIKKGIHK